MSLVEEFFTVYNPQKFSFATQSSLKFHNLELYAMSKRTDQLFVTGEIKLRRNKIMYQWRH